MSSPILSQIKNNSWRGFRDDLQGILREVKQARLDIDELDDSIDDAEDISDELMFELEEFFGKDER